MRTPTAASLIVGGTILLAACQGNVFELSEGTCFDDPGSGEVTDVPIVDCGEPHDNEVFATFELPDGDYPGQEEVDQQGFDGCIERFDEWAGIDYASSSLAVSTLTPTQEGWETLDDREVVCFVFDLDGARLEGSMEGRGV